MQNLEESYEGCCSCGPLPIERCPTPEEAIPVDDSTGKFYQEIATEMIGNALIIRVEKDKNRAARRFRASWDPPCDCEMVEIRRPGGNGESAKIVNGGDNNQILFKVFSNSRVPKDDNYKPQTIGYKVGSCRGATETNDQCRTITVYPQMGGPGSQEVHSDHVTEGCQDVFLLRIKKKGDTVDPRQRNIELELRTPRPPTPPPRPETPTPPEKPQEIVASAPKKTEKGKGKGKK